MNSQVKPQRSNFDTASLCTGLLAIAGKFAYQNKNLVHLSDCAGPARWAKSADLAKPAEQN